MDKARDNDEIKKDIDSFIVATIIFGAIQGLVEKAINNDFVILDKAADQLIKLLKEGLI